MRILLDTHVFLWLLNGDPRLPPAFAAQIRQSRNQVYLSVASIWEAVIKFYTGKLALADPPPQSLIAERVRHRIRSLEIDEGSIAHLAMLPSLHRDPFDRIIISQANQHGMLLATVDPVIRAYPVALLPDT